MTLDTFLGFIVIRALKIDNNNNKLSIRHTALKAGLYSAVFKPNWSQKWEPNNSQYPKTCAFHKAKKWVKKCASKWMKINNLTLSGRMYYESTNGKEYYLVKFIVSSIERLKRYVFKSFLKESVLDAVVMW